MTALLLVLCAAPLDARFLLSIDDVPSAELHVRVVRREFRYEVTQFLGEGATFSTRLVLDAKNRVAGRQPEVLALLSPPVAGCRAVLEERHNRAEQLCVDGREADVVHGRIDGVSFTATYSQGTLTSIDLPGARWERVSQPSTPRGDSPFAAGFPVAPASAVSLTPPLDGAQAVSVRATGTRERVDRARCLVLAREAAAADPQLEVVTGLIVEGNRAFPHAWVRRGKAFEDPSRLPADVPGKYLLLPTGRAGRVYLELVDGTRAVSAPDPESADVRPP